MNKKAAVVLHKVTAILLLSAGVWNWLLGGTPLASWKQILVSVLYFSSLFFVRTKRDLALFGFVVGVQLVLVVSSTARGLPLDSVLFNIYFYGAWLPFFLFAKYGEADAALQKHRNVLIAFIAASAIGLIIDLKSDIFNKLVDREFDNDYLFEIDAAKRAVFIFTTSTFVVPIMGILAALVLHVKYTNRSALILIAACAIAALSSGTLSASIILILFICGIVVDKFSEKPSAGIFLVMAIAVILLIIAQLQIDIFDKQIERILSNDTQSDSNIGRLALWSYALNKILSFNIMEHLSGLGVGVTNGKFMKLPLPHGESSIFQAYIEAGVLGTFLRIVPFLIALRHAHKNPILTFTLLGYFVGICVAPIFGNATNQALLGTVVGVLAFNHKRNCRKIAFSLRRHLYTHEGR